MVSLSLYPQFETNLMSNRKVIRLLLQLKSARAHGKNYVKVKPPLVRHPLRNRLLIITVDSRQLAEICLMHLTSDFNNEELYLTDKLRQDFYFTFDQTFYPTILRRHNLIYIDQS